jgi:lysophospholipase L1-like esterase
VRFLVGCLLATLLVAAPSASAEPAPVKLRWLALGDSYSSGEGVYGTGDGVVLGNGDECARSKAAWARLAALWVNTANDPAVRAMFGAFQQLIGGDRVDDRPRVDVDMTFLACSGAQTIEAGAAQDLDEQLAQATGTYDVITFSFGGNDAQFSPIIKGCLNPKPYGCDETEAAMVGRIRDEVAPKLDTAYRKIRQKLAPGGRVIVLGYPRLFDQPFLRRTCFGLIPRDDITKLRNVGAALNTTIQDAATRNDFDYVDVASAFEGHNACGRGIENPARDVLVWQAKERFPFELTPLCLTMKWVNGISLGVETGGRFMHSFHPNLCGHVVESLLVAQRVLSWKAIGDAPAKPERVNLYHGGLSVRVGPHETLQYRYGDPVAPVVDHLTQLFGLPGPEDTVAVEPQACGWADGMTWEAGGTPVLTVCVRDGTFVGYLQHEANPAITSVDGVTAGSPMWRLMLGAGSEIAFTEESRRLGGVIVSAHAYTRCDVGNLGDPPIEGVVSDPADWTGEVMAVGDRPELACAPTGPQPVPPAQYFHDFFYFFTHNGYLCGIAEEHAVCQGETSPVPPQPADCREGWGYGMGVEKSGAVDFLCAGGLMYGPPDRNPDDRDALPDGRSLSAYGFTCSVSGPEVRCVHDATGHGFAIAPTTNDRF